MARLDQNDYTYLTDREIASTGLGSTPAAVSFVADLQRAVYTDQPADTAVAQETAEQGVTVGTAAQVAADTAQTTADQSLTDAATAQVRADDAYDLAEGKVQKDAGPAFAAPLATTSRAALPAYAGGVAAVAYDAAEVGALKAQVAVLTAQLAAVVTDLRGNHALTP
jgi:hypothetical protein